jgi:hypothetical protein
MSGTPHSAYIEHDVITVQDASNTTQMRSTGISLSAAGSITFGDATVQITAANPFNGGTISGDITIADAGDYNANYAKNYLNLAGPGTYVNIQADYGIDLSNSNTGTELYLTSSGITFPDSTVQTTAYTGGGGVSWGGISGTISDQTDLQGELDGKYSTSNPSGFTNFSGYDAISAITGGGTSSISGSATSNGQVLTYNGSQIYWNAGFSGPGSSNSVWAYGNWYPANVTGIYDGYMNYYTVLTF